MGVSLSAMAMCSTRVQYKGVVQVQYKGVVQVYSTSTIQVT